ncbi:MerR family transcriptional regulator [Paenibacillus sp. alder61]|uniref:MerR family transcriptional regulator n=1 Tax=Paenibacillus sp. alder61 TaxID=2862948 RepID=UPI001CD19E27|nr:MerR family transcriptional regulator [Paenibacillus sp. alder61]MCA1292820.1 MerR family transcriptional regulator [Paenibacillus sp. alder61]
MKRWTTGQVAKQRNISVRTLRYYDQIDLLKPSFKDDSGRRLYTEEDLFHLEKIMILKSLSLPLEDMRDLLDKLTYKQILVSHYNYLQEQLSKLQTSISNTTSLINMIDLEESLSWEQVAQLVRVSTQTGAKKWTDYFQEEEKALLQEALPNISQNNETTRRYMALLRRIERCMKHRIPPESEEGYEIGRDVIHLTKETFQGDAELEEKFWEVRKRPAEETGLYPVSQEALEFVDRCIAYAEETQPPSSIEKVSPSVAPQWNEQ